MFVDIPAMARWALVALLTMSVGYLVVRLAGPRRPTVGVYAQDRETDIMHLAMAAAMIVMFAAPTAMSARTWKWFLLALTFDCGLWLIVVLALRSEPIRIATAGFHTFASAVMFYATTGLTWSPLTYAFVALFLVDAATTVVTSVRATTAPTWARVGVFPHVVMDLGTVMMLVAALPG